MSRMACKFKVIQFIPFSETEEFANVGIALFCPERRQLHFQLASGRFQRITHFFEQLDVRLYKATIEFIREELERVQALLVNEYQQSLALQIFDEATREKGGLIRFSSPKFVYAENFEEKTSELFQHYVERSFTKTPDWEQQLVQRVRDTLHGLGVAQHYKKEKLTAGLHSQTFPFVYMKDGVPLRAIKPVVFYQQQPERAVDRIDKLDKKLSELTGQGIIKEDNLLLEVSLKEDLDSRAREYIEKTLREFREKGLAVINADDEKSLSDFASQPFSI